MADDTPILDALKAAERVIERIKKRLEKKEAEVTELRAAYAKARPLTEAEREAMVAHVEKGGSLCCDVGLAWLRERLPEPWAQAINGWAYEHLGCAPPEDWRAYYSERVRKLALDQMPE